MSFSALGWGMGDITNAAKVIWTLLKHLDSKKGTRQKHKRSLDYLRSYLLPTLRLIPRYLKDIESQRNHPCWEEWNVSLNVMKHSWSKFNDYLQSRTGLLPENARDQPSIGVIPWTWDEVTGQIDNLRRELQDGLNDIDRLILWEIRYLLISPFSDCQTFADSQQKVKNSVSSCRDWTPCSKGSTATTNACRLTDRMCRMLFTSSAQTSRISNRSRTSSTATWRNWLNDSRKARWRRKPSICS